MGRGGSQGLFALVPSPNQITQPLAVAAVEHQPTRITAEIPHVARQGCSACLAMNDDKIPQGEYCVSTSNRNFEGRQGQGSRTILASPLVAAATAIEGRIVDITKHLN